MKRLNGKVAIITGGSRGMGSGHVRRFVQEGAKVVFTDILEEEGLALESELGESAKFIKQDVTSAKGWEEVVAETEKAFGPVDILVNNAGMSINKPITEMTEDEYRKVIDINQVSVFLGMKAVYPSMKKVENGSIINISSLGGLVARESLVAYGASKFAVRGMSKVAAVEFGGDGIRVNSVHPGIIETPMIAQDAAAKAVVDSAIQSIPLKRSAKPEEVTDLVLYLASDESSYSTGAEFVIDGGLFAI